MKQLVHSFMFMCFAFMTSSCLEEVEAPTSGTKANQVAFIIEDFIPAETTKSAFRVSNMKFQWSADDAIGIFPSSGYQTKFSMEEGAGTSTAIFDGGDWGLKYSGTYYAYYPFSQENFESEDMRSRVKFSYEGQEVCFADENGVVNLSKYDFMASGASTVENEAVNFRFKHLGALCRVRFQSPMATSYSSVAIVAGNNVFTISGHYNATTDNASFVSDSDKAYKFEVKFPSGNHYEAGENIELYFLMPPVDLTGESVKFEINLPGSESMTFDIASRNIQAGQSYGWDFEINADDYYVKPDYETANSYIISQPGTYSFLTVRGNGHFYINDITSAEVLWESFGTDVAPNVGDLISEVSYSDNQIIYTIPEPFKEGNAVIAAKDANGKILWSWHIWLTDKPEDQVYRNNAGTMMDRNLGAISATPGDVGALGLLYQWGRKDPFIGSSSISEPIEAKTTWNNWPKVESTESSGSVEYAIANPTTFIYNSYWGDWMYTSDDALWQSTKTIYDPCPAGYRVPDGGSGGVWATAFGTNDSFSWLRDDANYGYSFGGSDESVGHLSDVACWYPDAGCMYPYNGILNNVGSYGTYWSCTPNSEVGAYNMCLYLDWAIIPLNTDMRSIAVSVRCFKENSASEPEPVAVVNLSEDGMANSYIVSEAGTYKFSTVQGNSNVSVGIVASAEVLWESFGTDVIPETGALVTGVTYADNTITFRASDLEGNAVIAAKDANGSILWSWHIWLTDKPEDQIYRNDAGTMMDRNLGATSATPGDVGALGLFYQWGRKDPFLGSSSISGGTIAVSANSVNWSYIISTESTGTIAYATAHPTTFIGGNEHNMYDWHYTGDNTNDNTRWVSSKTIYDPCPPGYRVPDCGSNSIWAKAFGLSGLIEGGVYDAVNNGVNFGKNDTNVYLTEETSCWYPIAGCLYSLENVSEMDRTGAYTVCADESGIGSFIVVGAGLAEPDPGDAVLGSGNYMRQGGFSVRCQKED